ncbi:MAG: hypothetical protein AB8B86_12180 [Pseudomonadales bacterium]
MIRKRKTFTCATYSCENRFDCYSSSLSTFIGFLITIIGVSWIVLGVIGSYQSPLLQLLPNKNRMLQLAELDRTEYRDRPSTFLLMLGVGISLLVHVSSLLIDYAGHDRVISPPIHLELEKSLVPAPGPQPSESEQLAPKTEAEIPDLNSDPKQSRPTFPEVRPIESSPIDSPAAAVAKEPLAIDVKKEVQAYLDSLPAVEGSDLEGRVFDPVLAAKIYEARRNSKARPGLGPGSYEKGGEHSTEDPNVFSYSAGSWQRWVKVDGKCFLVIEQSGVDALRGAFDNWMRTSCKKFNSKFFEEL